MFFSRKSRNPRVTREPGTISVSSRHVRDRITFLGLTPADLGTIASWRDACAAAIDPLVDAFYGHMRRYADAWAYIEKHSSVERQRPLIRRYVLTMFDGRIDDAYVQYRERVGAVHDDIDLDGSLYVGMYEVIRRQLARAVEGAGATLDEVLAFETAFNRLIDLDIALVTTALMASRQGKTRDASRGAAAQFVQAIGGSLEGLANRDLTVHLPGGLPEDFRPVIASFDRAVSNMRETMREIAAAAEQVADAAAQISAGSSALADAASEQTGSIQVVGDTLRNLTDATERTANSATEAGRISQEGQQAVERSDDVMRRLGVAMGKIRESAAQTARIVRSIDEIAFQTNLLALNAAVEAARAGDAGRGFAVVAEEVRALALRSAEAAKTTAELLEEARVHSASGVALGGEVGGQLTEIRGHVDRLSEVMAEINADVHRERDQIREIERRLDAVSLSTQTVAANAEEASASAVELSSQAQQMREQVGRFTLGRSAQNAARAPQERSRAG